MVIDTTLESDNPLNFRKNLVERNLIMTIDDKIRYGKLQYGINKESAKIWALSSKNDWRARKKQVEVLKPEESKECTNSIEGFFPKDASTNEIKNEINNRK